MENIWRIMHFQLMCILKPKMLFTLPAKHYASKIRKKKKISEKAIKTNIYFPFLINILAFDPNIFEDLEGRDIIF